MSLPSQKKKKANSGLVVYGGFGVAVILLKMKLEDVLRVTGFHTKQQCAGGTFGLECIRNEGLLNLI